MNQKPYIKMLYKAGLNTQDINLLLNLKRNNRVKSINFNKEG